MKLLPLAPQPDTRVESITLESPDGIYASPRSSDVVFKRGQFLFRHRRDSWNGTDYVERAWDLDYHNPAYRDYPYVMIYKGPEV